jgi:hypothetical protein
MLNPEQIYHRKKDVLYNESGAAVLKFIGDTNNAENLTGNLVENMNNYIRCYPERVEVIEIKKQTSIQIDLF